jgi:hypothetical protein
MASKNRSDGDGSVYYDQSRDRWVGVLVTGWRDGKPIRKKVSATSKTGASSKLRKLREHLDSGTLVSGRNLTVEKWLTYWLEHIVATKNRPNTVRTYTTYTTCYLIPLLGHHRLDRLTPEHINDAWRQSSSPAHSRSPWPADSSYATPPPTGMRPPSAPNRSKCSTRRRRAP